MSAQDIIQAVRQAKTNIKQLQKILKDMDPASGVTLAIRQGVAADNDAVEHDAERRPWVSVEVIDLALARDAIGAAVAASESSLAFRVMCARDDHTKLGEFLAELDAPPATKVSTRRSP